MSSATKALSSLAVAAASFLLYSNLLVVLSRQSSVPTAVAVLVPALLMFAVLHRLVVCREGIVVDRTLLMMLALFAVLLVSAFPAPGLEQAVSRMSVYAIEGLLMYFLVRNAIGSLGELRWAAVGVVIASVMLALLALVQAGTGNYEQDFMGLAERSLEHLDEPGRTAAPESQMGLEDRAYGPVGDPNRFAQMLMMALPIALVLGMTAKSRLGSLLAFGSVLAVLGGIFVTYSRGAFLTLAVLVVLMVPMRLMSARKLIALTVVAVLLAPIVAPGYTQRMVSIGGVAELFGSSEAEADGATEGRTTEMLAALAAYTDHPVLGVGPGQYLHYYSVYYQGLPEISIRAIPEPRRAHSLYLELGAELGTIGLVAFLAIPLLLLRDLRVLRLGLAERRPDLSRLAASFSLVLLAYLGTGVFLHLAFERYYWFMIGMTAAAAGELHKRSQALRLDDSHSWAARPTSL
ncbi:MAG TPA: O-antigen ligase family protein [Longimicrobiales bacterium]|nr:O-antigen ligase family protein [Longimicrobiales bacterium]